jgi:hypothetical protein
MKLIINKQGYQARSKQTGKICSLGSILKSVMNFLRNLILNYEYTEAHRKGKYVVSDLWLNTKSCLHDVPRSFSYVAVKTP